MRPIPVGPASSLVPWFDLGDDRRNSLGQPPADRLPAEATGDMVGPLLGDVPHNGPNRIPTGGRETGRSAVTDCERKCQVSSGLWLCAEVRKTAAADS